MERSHAFWRAQSCTVAPSGSGRKYTVEITDQGGAPLATCDAEGTVRDTSGDALLVAPLREGGRRDRPTDVGIEVADAGGQALGAGRVVKYGLGPRARKATLAIVDPQGGEVARLEPRDKKGEELAMLADGSELATIAVESVKSGLLRKSRVYTAHLADEIPDTLRPLVLAVAIRYDAILNAVVATSARED